MFALINNSVNDKMEKCEYIKQNVREYSMNL